jgi:lipoprotein-releasing system permease protein
MNLPFFIAGKYFFSRKSPAAINIISGISMLAVSFVSAALIILFSVFNGFEHLIVSLYNSFDPGLVIAPVKGKTFDSRSFPLEEIKKMEGVKYVVESLEENALLKYGEEQYIAAIKGVSDDFLKASGLDSMMVAGRMILTESKKPSPGEEGVTITSPEQEYAIAGNNIAIALALRLDDPFTALRIFVPKRGSGYSINPEEAFSEEHIIPAGVFSIQQEFDSKYVLVPLKFARRLFGYSTEATAVEVTLTPGADEEAVKARVKKLAGENFTVKDRAEQHELLYKIVRSEKWAIYLILTFVLIIAAFNVIGSVTMLIIEKKKDIGVLWSMGAGTPLVRNIFLVEGMMISFTGAFSGLALGTLVCWVQEKFGVIKLQGSGSFVVDAYPVHMQPADFVYVLITVLLIGFAAAWFPARRLVKNHVESGSGLAQFNAE